MVRMKSEEPAVRTVYYFKPGQNALNTKVSERSLALIVPQSVYDGFSKNVLENEKVALHAEREAKRIAALKQAAHNMTKTWEDTAHNLARVRRKEILSRRKVEEAERIKFIEEMKVKNALERAEVINQAKNLMFHRKPQCRLIDRALLVSECYRELEEQIKFKNSLRDKYKKLEEEYAQFVREDVKKFDDEEKKKREAELMKARKNREELEIQITENRKNLAKMENLVKKSETEELKNMAEEIREIKEKELKEAFEKKKLLKKMFSEAIEEKRQYEIKMRAEDEFQEKSLEIYKTMKKQMDKQAKEKDKKRREERALLVDKLAQKIGGKLVSQKRLSQKIEKERKLEESEKMEEQKKIEELERIDKEKQKKENARLEMQQYLKCFEEEKEKRKKEEEDLKLWETMQRYKRDEFNKKWNLQHLEEETKKKENYSKLLKIQMAVKDQERKQARVEEDDSALVKEIIDKANQRVLDYGEEVLNESRGIRPVYPIEKTIHQFKKEIGLIPSSKKGMEYENHSEIPKKRRGRRKVCTKPTKEEDILILG